MIVEVDEEQLTEPMIQVKQEIVYISDTSRRQTDQPALCVHVNRSEIEGILEICSICAAALLVSSTTTLLLPWLAAYLETPHSLWLKYVSGICEANSTTAAESVCLPVSLIKLTSLFFNHFLRQRSAAATCGSFQASCLSLSVLLYLPVSPWCAEEVSASSFPCYTYFRV